MTNERTCPQCGCASPVGNAEGLCPGCLLAKGLAATTAGFTEPPQARTQWQEPSVEELAPHFPELDILELIGRGGMGAVYKARQKNLDRLVALKILPPEIAHDAAFAQRFTQEAQAMARLSHPHIVAIHEFGQRGDIYFFLMEYVDGLSLRQVLNRGHIEPREALAIVPQICDALQYAHDRGIVHRDIKPENILLNRQGQVKVADFGLAKLIGRDGGVAGVSPAQSTAEGGCATGVAGDFGEPGRAVSPAQAGAPQTIAGERVVGTPQYMAPEQIARPANVDHRADIYSLGVVFYQMLTGELPASRLEPPSHKVLIDVRLDEVVLRALEKHPERRYQQASEVKTHVETIISTAPPLTSATPSQAGANASGTPDQPRFPEIAATSQPRARRITAIFGKVFRWSARILGTLWIAMFLLFLVGEGSPPLGTQPANVQLGFAAMGLWLIGFSIGWKWDGVAAILILLGSAMFHAILHPRWGWAGELPTFIGLLYAMSWWLNGGMRRTAHPSAPPPAPSALPRSSPAVDIDPAKTLLARQAVRAPAIGLIVAAGINIASILVLGTLGYFAASFAGGGYWYVVLFVPGGVGLVLAGFMLWTALGMMKLKGRGKAILAAIMAMAALPTDLSIMGLRPSSDMFDALWMFMIPSFVVGVPVGLWAFVVLCRREVAQAFRWVSESHSLDQTPAERTKQKWRRAASYLVIAIGLSLFVRTFIFQVYRVQNDAVAPEVPVGSTVFVYKLAQTFEPGDIIVYRHEGKNLLGRVVRHFRPETSIFGNNDLEIERRGQAGQGIRFIDVAGKVVFNTRNSASNVGWAERSPSSGQASPTKDSNGGTRLPAAEPRPTLQDSSAQPASQPATRQGMVIMQGQPAGARDDLLRRKVELELELADSLRRFAPESRKNRDIQAKLDVVKKQLAEMDGSASQPNTQPAEKH